MDMSMVPEGFRSGFVTLIGRPNAGKSTLLNAIMGKKLAITTSTAQTTRHRFRAVLTTDDAQLVIVDTPGIHKPHDALGEELNNTSFKSLDGIDVIAFLLDATQPLGKGDAWIIEKIASDPTPKILVINKIDEATPEQVVDQKLAAERLCTWDAVCELSAKTGEGVAQFIACVKSYLPEGPHWFPPDMETDQPLEVIIAEFIREKILTTVYDEVPHAVGVLVDELSYDEKKDLYRIYASIYVERQSQKGILIGKGGATIKSIGIEARKDLEAMLQAKVFIDLQVKVKPHWRRDLNWIKRIGYGEGVQ